MLLNKESTFYMLDLLLSHINTPGFLAWWHNNPIILGGDKYSPFPGVGLYYLQHSDNRTFEVKIQPIQHDCPKFTQMFLSQILQSEENSHIELRVKRAGQLIGTLAIDVDNERKWAFGEGEWMLLDEESVNWQFEWNIY